MKRFKVVIFVHGCFWHQHEGCRYATTPNTRHAFWQEKFAKNRARDGFNIQSLQELGWRVIVVWECATRHNPLSHLEGLSARIKEIDRNNIQIPFVE